jgi:hypothetical protein
MRRNPKSEIQNPKEARNPKFEGSDLVVSMRSDLRNDVGLSSRPQATAAISACPYTSATEAGAATTLRSALSLFRISGFGFLPDFGFWILDFARVSFGIRLSDLRFLCV